MRLMVHIFKKDIRKLWWAVVVTLVLLVAVANMDRSRTDWLAGSDEGWMNILLPLAWACLAALAVHEEPLAGDRHFWLTRPYTRVSLLGAKLLFMIAVIHIPYLISGIVVLASHGFSPFECLLHLLWKQIVLAAVVTVPAIALAALFDNIAYFTLAAITATGAIAYIAEFATLDDVPWMIEDKVRPAASILTVLIGAAAVIALQYGGRRTRASRIIGIATAAIAALVATYFPPELAARVRATISPAPQALLSSFSSSLAARHPGDIKPRTIGGVIQLAIPMTISGVIEDVDSRLDQLHLEITGSDGRRYHSPEPGLFRTPGIPDMFVAVQRDNGPSWLILGLRPSVFESLNRGKVQMKATYSVAYHYLGQPVWMSVGGKVKIAGVGLCFTVITEPAMLREGILKVLCESPSAMSPLTQVELSYPATGRQWKQRHLGDSSPSTSWPRGIWLSPLYRLQTFFPFSSGNDPSPAAQWRVPREFLPDCKIAIIPDIITGWAATSFELHDVNLRDYLWVAPR